MATFKLTPDTGQVSGTNTNMPLVVIPSELEMGALTTAEAKTVTVGDGGVGYEGTFSSPTTISKTLLITAQYYDTNLWSVLSAEIQ
jgi:hypothetical protein